ncbi:MAG: diaminopimelate decarboxylase family protein, partial [Waddliaceae bacterium]
RYLVADAGVLLTTVTSIKGNGIPFLGLDAGMNTLLRPALYKTYHHILLANDVRATHDTPYHLVGPICENTDEFASKRPLPKNISSGDVLALLDTGAYGFSMSSQYNTQPRAAEVLVCEGKADIIRQRENFSDIIRGVSIPDRLTT